MYVNSNEDWMRYSKHGDWKLSNIKNGGKWMHYYKEREFATEIVNKAIEAGIVEYAKHTKGASGIVCLYCSGDDLDAHLLVINFMRENNLIRLTKDYNYFDVSFKFNGQSWSKQFGPNLEGMIKLSDFINLENGKPTDLQSADQLIKIDYLTKSKAIRSNSELSPLLTSLDKFIIDHVNQTFKYKPTETDLNDKIISLAPHGYNLRLFYSSKSYIALLSNSAHLISLFLKSDNPKHQVKINKLKAKADSSLLHLIELLSTNQLELNSNQLLENYDFKLNERFIANFQHLDFNQTTCNVLGYLLFLSIYHVKRENIDYICKASSQL